MEGYGCPGGEVWLPQSLFGVKLASPMFSELARVERTVPVTLELFNSQRQSKGLATHQAGVVTQKT